MAKKSLFIFLTGLVLMIVFNLSQLNIPTDKTLYNNSTTYLLETGNQFDLASYQQNDFGMGMTTSNNNIELLTENQAAFARIISEIQNAHKSINVAVYIIRDDEIGNQFKNLLIEKAGQGVEVRLLYDAWGSAFTPRSYFRDLLSNGVKVSVFNPLVTSFLQGRLDNRLHRKMIIIDGKKAFIGGLNIGDEYLSKDRKIGFWKDTGVMLDGDAVLSVQQVFLTDWLQASGEKVLSQQFFPKVDNTGSKTAAIILGSPESPQTSMKDVYIQLINSAEEKINIVTPYVFPDTATLNALYKAVEKNVEVTLILPGKPDNKVARLTNPYYCNKLLQHGIRVSTYDRGFIHSKTIIVDDKIGSIGTANFDLLSFFKSYEITSLINDAQIIQQMQDDFLQDLSYSHPSSKD